MSVIIVFIRLLPWRSEICSFYLIRTHIYHCCCTYAGFANIHRNYRINHEARWRNRNDDRNGWWGEGIHHGEVSVEAFRTWLTKRVRVIFASLSGSSKSLSSTKSLSSLYMLHFLSSKITDTPLWWSWAWMDEEWWVRTIDSCYLLLLQSQLIPKDTSSKLILFPVLSPACSFVSPNISLAGLFPIFGPINKRKGVLDLKRSSQVLGVYPRHPHLSPKDTPMYPSFHTAR